jgi:hypothetical protein
MGTKNNPGAYDCYANAHPDEPMFILLGRDAFAGSLVTLWAEARETDGEDPAKVQEARDCADAMDEYCGALGKPLAEVLAWLPFDLLADELRRRGATVTPIPHGGDSAEVASDQQTHVRSVSIEFNARNDFTVREGSRYQEGLCWDEMLGSIAELTHPKIGECRYDLLTTEEWKARREAQEKRMAEVRASNQGTPSVPRPKPCTDERMCTPCFTGVGKCEYPAPIDPDRVCVGKQPF